MAKEDMAEFVLLTTNRIGVLARVTAMVTSIGANIERAEVRSDGDSALSTIRFHSEITDVQRDRLARKLDRLVDVLEVKVL